MPRGISLRSDRLDRIHPQRQQHANSVVRSRTCCTSRPCKSTMASSKPLPLKARRQRSPHPFYPHEILKTKIEYENQNSSKGDRFEDCHG